MQRRIVEGSSSPTYPKTTAEVRALLEPAWDLFQLESLEATEETNLTFYANNKGQAKPSAARAPVQTTSEDAQLCPVCGKAGHQVRKCFLLKNLRSEGLVPSRGNMQLHSYAIFGRSMLLQGCMRGRQRIR
jgi:hypothetical protein